MQPLYRTQRAMRAMRRTALQRGVVALIDIGTSKIACLVLKVETPPRGVGDAVGPMAGQAGFRVIGAATTRSRGVRHGEIDHLAETERAIRTAVQSAQKMAGIRVDHVIACFSGAAPMSSAALGRATVEGATVGDLDIGRALAQAEGPDLGATREVLHAQPVLFGLDGRRGLGDPRGQVGRELECDLHLLSVEAGPVETLLHCLRRCDLDCAGLASSAYLSGLASLVEDEQELGAVCIDIGGGVTGLSVFLRKHMITAEAVPMGGDAVTQDISALLGVPFATAERLKTLHGGVVATGADDREMIATPNETGDWEHDRRQVSRAELIGIIRPRMEEILEAVRARLDAAGFDRMPGRSIVLTGGASQMPGLDGLASRILGHKVRLGRPLRVQGLPHTAAGPSHAAAVGLALMAANPQDECWDFEAPSVDLPGRPLNRAVRWLKANW